MRLLIKIDSSEWGPKSELLTKTYRSCTICPPPISHSLFTVWLCPFGLSALQPLTLLSFYLYETFVCVFISRGHIFSVLSWLFPHHLDFGKVYCPPSCILLSFFPLITLFVSFIASPQFVFYPLAFCMSPLPNAVPLGRECLSSLLLYSEHLRQCPALSRCSVNI